LRDSGRKDVVSLARAVDERLIQPVRPLLGDALHLLVSPDGAINLIPIEALVDEHGRYLIEHYSFTYLTSGRDLLRLESSRDRGSAAIVVANPFFGEPAFGPAARRGPVKPSTNKLKARSNPSNRRQSATTGADQSDIYFAPIAGTALEGEAIALLLPDARLVTGAHATESSLKQLVAPRILHIATHGFFLGGRPDKPAAGGDTTRAISGGVKIENPLLRSGLALAGANQRRSGDQDGILTALEASGLDLWGTRLVTLSACDTGIGEVRIGEGVYGLRRAFVLAGAESMVMSLWPVSDLVTRELMSAYYRKIKEGVGRGEALRRTQLQMLQTGNRRHPFYWASFIQIGEWANLEGKR
jgi:CHAT domain-containing protein